MFLKKSTNNHEYYSFSHPSSLQYTEVYNYCRSIFSDETSFEESSQAIARRLYSESSHPRVKGGELYVVYFDAIPVESRMCKAIGLFKAESKTVFLDTKQNQGSINLTLLEGIEIAKIDKGCLVINQKEEDQRLYFIVNQ